jgi:hypothetical protein
MELVTCWSQLTLSHEIYCIISFQFWRQRGQVGSLKSAMVEVFLPWKSANATRVLFLRVSVTRHWTANIMECPICLPSSSPGNGKQNICLGPRDGSLKAAISAWLGQFSSLCPCCLCRWGPCYKPWMVHLWTGHKRETSMLFVLPLIGSSCLTPSEYNQLFFFSCLFILAQHFLAYPHTRFHMRMYT